MPIIRSSRVLYSEFYVYGTVASILQTGHITLSYTPDQQLENHSTKYHRQQPLYNTLELLMMGIVVPETCWASNKICNKKPLLHLFGILFPHVGQKVFNSNKNIPHFDALLPLFPKYSLHPRHLSFHETIFLFPLDGSTSPVLSANESQLFPTHDSLKIFLTATILFQQRRNTIIAQRIIPLIS